MDAFRVDEMAFTDLNVIVRKRVNRCLLDGRDGDDC